MTSSLRRLAAVPVLIALAAACASTRVERQLDPKSRDFVSKARYIITADERKTFLALPAEAREDFVADFWRRRDPTPADGGERVQARVLQAHRALQPPLLRRRPRPAGSRTAAGSGSRSDLPTTGKPIPAGVTFYGVPTEIWWYGFFPIIFVDERWVDDYRLDPSSATQLSRPHPGPAPVEPPCGGSGQGLRPGPHRAARRASRSGSRRTEAGSARFVVVLPYRNIWMKSKGDGFEASLDVDLKVVDGSGAEVWSFVRSYPLEVLKDRLKTALTESFTAEAVAPLKPGSYRLKATVVNSNDGSKASFEQAFDL
ncbi:MAG: GWxTD domain-containing protein [Candidatus Moduliflexus flocculans]|nr:GWxTD domain-containing protein [Candidatus Moduliflexus flocculans]